jgi:hypothetical protein
MKRLLLIAVLFSLLSGCGGGSDGGGSTPPIVGTWVSRSIQINNQAVQNCPVTTTFDNAPIDCAANDTVTFRSDGTFSESGGVNGTYTLTGSVLRLQSAAVREGQATFVGNTFTLLLIAQNNVDTARLMYAKQ